MNNLIENEEKTISEILYLINNPEEFKKRLKENFFSIESDSILKSAIQVLQLDCYLGSHEEIKRAKSTLKGISAPIPKEVQVKRTKYHSLKYFEANIEKFQQLVDSYRLLAKKALEQTKCYNGDLEVLHRQREIAKILQVPKKYLNQIERLRPLNLAFACIGYRFDIKPASVKDLKFKPKPIKKLPVGLVTWVNINNEPVTWKNNK